MYTIFDYIATIESTPIQNSTGDGISVVPLLLGDGSGTCGCVGLATIPALTGDGTADWAPFSACTLPALDSTGTDADYHPAWGDPETPAMESDGTAHVVIESVTLLTPFFLESSAGAIASNALPAFNAYGLDDSFARTASGAALFSTLTGEAIACGLYKPIANSLPSVAVVGLLQQGNISLADAAATLFHGLTTSDAIAAKAARYVAGFSYVSDGDGYGDTWTCALATYQRKYGDCEDGAILIHGLLLAAGVESNRIMTCFGTAGGSGHAWTIYRRESDEEWVPLEWTDSALASLASVDNLKRMLDVRDTYTAVAYILTATSFSAVTTPDWVKKLTLLTAEAALSFPALSVSGRVGSSASATLRLFQGLLATSLTVQGKTGARASLKIPLQATGVGSQKAFCLGSVKAPQLVTQSRAGARATIFTPEFSMLGQCSGTAGRLGLALPACKISGAATVDLIGKAALPWPLPLCKGEGSTGSLAAGVVRLDRIAATGRLRQGPAAHAACGLPDVACQALAAADMSGTLTGMRVAASGVAGLRAAAALALRTAIVASGLVGVAGRGAATLPCPTGGGEMSAVASSRGEASIICRRLLVDASGSAGVWGVGVAMLPCPTGGGEMSAAASSRGDASLSCRRLLVEAKGFVGGVGAAVALLPMLRDVGEAKQGPMALAVCRIPNFICDMGSSPDAVADSDEDLPMFSVFGHATSPISWNSPLHYDPMRWR